MLPSNAQYHRKSIRIKGYDYTQPGGYFITIATYNHQFLFGDISESRVTLNHYGEIALTCWNEIPDHFQNVTLDAFIVMPNHIHGLLIIEEKDMDWSDGVQNHPQNTSQYYASVAEQFGKPVPGSIPTIIRSYKSVVTKKINLVERMPKGIVWQSNYYEHIVRDKEDLYRIRDYILANPENWFKDEENPSRKK